MKVKRNTPDLLIAEEVPWFISIMLFIFIMAFVIPGVMLVFMGEWAGLIFALGGGGLGFGGMCVFVERLQVILDARTMTITLRRRTILGHQERVLPLTGLLRAATERSTSSGKSRQTLYRPVLVLEDRAGGGEQRHPVTEVYSSGRSAERLVAAVNGWLGARDGRAA